jgi:hypothetical protein
MTMITHMSAPPTKPIYASHLPRKLPFELICRNAITPVTIAATAGVIPTKSRVNDVALEALLCPSIPSIEIIRQPKAQVVKGTRTIKMIKLAKASELVDLVPRLAYSNGFWSDN